MTNGSHTALKKSHRKWKAHHIFDYGWTKSIHDITELSSGAFGHSVPSAKTTNIPNTFC